MFPPTCRQDIVGLHEPLPRPPTPQGQRTLLQGGDKWQAIGTVKSEKLKTFNSDMAQIQCPSFLRGIIAPKAQ